MIITLSGADFSGDGNNINGVRYTITFVCKDESGATLTSTSSNKKLYSEGANITFTSSNAPIVNGYTFKSASPASISNLNANTTVTVTYSVSSSGGGDPVTPTSLDDIAYEEMSYREIFITNNRAPDINNNSMTNSFGNVEYTDSTGTTLIVTDETAAANYVPPYSLKVSGSSSQQAIGSWKANGTKTAYFLAANVKVTDYVKGYCGMIYGTEFLACANRITDGYEVFAGITPELSTSQLFIGSASSANLTGYINNPVAIRTSIFKTIPTIEKFTALYKNYTALLIAGNK